MVVLLGTPLPAYFLWIELNRPPPPPIKLADALAALDEGHNGAAAQLGRRLFEAEIYAPRNHGGPAYVLGIVAARRAEEATGTAQRDLWALAVNYLYDASHQGWPPGREAHALFTLGVTLGQLGRHAESIERLREALAASQVAGQIGPPRAAEVHRLLAIAYQRLPKPRWTEALEHNDKHLSDPELSAAEREAALIEKARIQFELGQDLSCRETLAQVPPESPQAVAARLLEARLILREARQLRGIQSASGPLTGDPAFGVPPPTDAALEKYQQALAAFKAVAERPSLERATSPEALYLLGECQAEMGDHAAARESLRAAAQEGGHDPAVAAAELRRAEILLRQGQPTEAMLALQGALKQARAADEYDNPWLSLPAFRNRTTVFHTSLLAAGELRLALRLATQMYPLFSREEQQELLADTHRACAARLEEKARAKGDKQSEYAQAAIQHHRRAAQTFSRLARLEYATPRYPRWLWAAAQSYVAAGEHASAETLLRRYLTYDVSRQDRPRAIVQLAEVQLAQGKPRHAGQTLRECRQRFSEDPIVYAARLMAAEAAIHAGDYDEAQAALEENLDGTGLTPASGEWRDSLFLLGKVHSLRGHWADVVRVLQEAITRYPAAKQALSSRYLLADAHMRLAQDHEGQTRSPSKEEQQRHKSARQRHLEAALAQLTEAVAVGRDRADASFDEPDRVALRNARFAHVAVLFQLGRHEEAVRTCADLINRYAGAAEVLEAYVQLAAGLRRLNRADEARASLAQALAALDKLAAEASFANTTNRSKAEWKSYLEWLAKE